MTTVVLEVRQLVQSPATIGNQIWQPKSAKAKVRTVQKETFGKCGRGVTLLGLFIVKL
jgi:hypothetical protein